jgi:hypothetical protein
MAGKNLHSIFRDWSACVSRFQALASQPSQTTTSSDPCSRICLALEARNYIYRAVGDVDF